MYIHINVGPRALRLRRRHLAGQEFRIEGHRWHAWGVHGYILLLLSLLLSLVVVVVVALLCL